MTSLSKVIALLAGESDEHKFAGLMLATKVLSVADTAAAEDVFDAVGMSFLNRLLLPLRDSRFTGTINEADVLIQQTAGVALALAVLSALTRTESVASNPELLDILPPLCRLLCSPSLNGACEISRLPGNFDMDSAVLSDAIGILTHMCTQSRDTALVALDCRAVSALTAWMQTHARTAAPETVQSAAHCVAHLAVVAQQELLRESLSGQTDYSEQLVSSLEALSYLVDCRQTIPAESTGQSGVAGNDTSDEGQDDEVRVNDVRVQKWRDVQLEALGLLADLLSRISGHVGLIVTVMAAHEQRGQAAAGSWAWAAYLRGGTERVLTGRLPVKHSATALIAIEAMVQVCGVSSLLHASGESTKGEGGKNEFLSVLLQVMKVQMYGHLQAMLFAAASPDTSTRRDQFDWHHSAAAFTATSRLMEYVMDLLLLLDDGQSSSSLSAGKPGLTTDEQAVLSNEVLAHAFEALQESMVYILDFCAGLTRSELDESDNVEPTGNQVKTHVAHAASERAAQTSDTESTVVHDGVVEQNDTDSTDLPNTTNLAGVRPRQADVGIGVEALPVCCNDEYVQSSVLQCLCFAGKYLALIDGGDLLPRLLAMLPGLIEWLRKHSSTSKPEGSRGGDAAADGPVAGASDQAVTALVAAMYGMGVHSGEEAKAEVREQCWECVIDPTVCGTLHTILCGMCGDYKSDGKAHTLLPMLCELLVAAYDAVSAKQLEMLFVQPVQHGEVDARTSDQTHISGTASLDGCIHMLACVTENLLNAMQDGSKGSSIKPSLAVVDLHLALHAGAVLARQVCLVTRSAPSSSAAHASLENGLKTLHVGVAFLAGYSGITSEGQVAQALCGPDTVNVNIWTVALSVGRGTNKAAMESLDLVAGCCLLCRVLSCAVKERHAIQSFPASAWLTKLTSDSETYKLLRASLGTCALTKPLRTSLTSLTNLL